MLQQPKPSDVHPPRRHWAIDRTTNASHARRLFDAAKEPKALWIPACDRHERIWNAFPQEADARTVEFFRKHF